MNAKSIALAITLAAVAIALNAVRIPAVFYPGTFFQFSQIPIVVAFLLFGVRTGVLVGVLNLIGGLSLFPLGSAGFIVYPMDFVSLLLMFAGIWVASLLISRGDESRRFSFLRKPLVGSTVGAAFFRAGIMPLIDYAIVNRILVPLILGFHRPETALMTLIPAFVVYNLIVPLYAVPIACLIAARVGRHLGIESRFLKTS